MSNSDSVSSMENLYKYSRNRRNPQDALLTGIASRQNNDRMGILPKFIAGAMLSRNQGGSDPYMQLLAQKSQAEAQTKQRVLWILQDHEQQGVPDDHTFQALMEEYANSGNQIAFNLAKQFKPTASSSDLGEYTKHIQRRAMLTKSRGYNNLDAQESVSKNDQDLQFIDAEMERLRKRMQGMNTQDPSAGYQGGMQNRPSNPKVPMPVTPSPNPSIEMPVGEGGQQPNFLNQNQLEEQNKMAIASKRIEQLRSKYKDDEIANWLRQKGQDPKRFGING